MARYFLGFPAAYFSARVILKFAEREKEGKYSLIVLTILMSLLAVFTGLIVPKVSLMPASLINTESFYDAFSVPVQLIRGILALGAALSLWSYSSIPSEAALRPSWFLVRFVPTKWMITLTLIVFISAGWIFTNNLDYYAGSQTLKRSSAKVDSELNRLTRELSVLGKATLSMSKASVIRAAVSSPQGQSIEKARALLNQVKNKFGALDCSLLDTQGALIVSSDNSESEITAGKSYSLRPYFKGALSGGSGYYLKLGRLYNERVYYVGYPVRNILGKIIGVAVIVKNIHTEPLFQYRLLSITVTFLVCIITIIFFIALRKREALILLIEKVHSQLKEVDRMKTDFISIVSHELRTPLTSITNAAGILMKGGPAKRPVDEREREMIKIILDSADRQTRMVSDLLDVSKIEAGVMPIYLKHTDIAGLIRDAIALLRPLARDKNINLVLSLDISEVLVYVDPDHVRRILNNLVVNAIKFTPEKGTVTIKAEDAVTEVKITVADTGIGISAADKENLFKKFFRSPDAAVQEKGGFGLGLIITKNLVEAQKGTIWVDSDPGKGSSFCFTLPVLKQNELRHLADGES